MRKFTYFFILILCIFCIGMPVLADEMPVVESVSTDFIAFPSQDPYEKVIALYGHDLDYLLFNDVRVQFGPAVAHSITGNDSGINLAFILDPAQFIHNQDYVITVSQNNQVLLSIPQAIHVSNPLYTTPKNTRTKRFLNRTDNRKVSKRTVGVNMHWGLGAADSEQDLYRNKLVNSETKWVREFISYDSLMGENRNGWLERYDKAMLEYEKQNVRVVVMLAYGSGDDPHVPPSSEQWAEFVEIVADRYRNYVDAWEIWNEPDSPDYMHPNTVNALVPLLKVSYPIIKKHDPNSIVLNGPIADIKHKKFVKKLYSRAGEYFDELSIHLYYCDEYIQDGNNDALSRDLEKLYKYIPEDRRDEKIWITEFGCSLAVPGMTEDIQRQYLKRTSRQLLETGKFRNILIYNLRDRPYMDSYEALFGLMDAAGNNKPAWTWYRKLPKK